MKSKIFKPKSHSIWIFFYGNSCFARAFDSRAEGRQYLKQYRDLLGGNVSKLTKYCRDY